MEVVSSISFVYLSKFGLDSVLCSGWIDGWTEERKRKKKGSERCRQEITTTEREMDKESERWISMSETPYITLLLLSVQ